MMRGRGFEDAVAEFLHEEAEWAAPRYLDEILSVTQRTDQRPAWLGSLGRFQLPTSRHVLRSRALLRVVLVAALLAALAAAIVSVGTPRLPPPLGLAGNGVIVFGAANGDLQSLDLATGLPAPLLAGSTWDESPDFSHDGTRMVFARRSGEAWRLVVANADGTGARAFTPEVDPTWNAWSTDDTRVLVVDGTSTTPALTVYDVVGDGAPRTIDLDGQHPQRATFRPDDREIVFLGGKGGTYGLYAVATDGRSPMRTIVAAVVGTNTITEPVLSPDGTVVAYTRWDGDRSVIHLVTVVAADDEMLRLDPDSVGENVAGWTPDGGRLLFHLHRDDGYQLAVGSVDGGPVIEIGPAFPEGTGGATVVFSPDGRQVLARYESDGSHWLLDLAGGTARQLDLPATASVAWQRVAE